MTDPTSTSPPPTADRRGVSAGRVVMIVAGSLLVLLAAAVVFAGAALTWAHATQRDDDGFFSTGTERLDTATPVITADEIDLGVAPGDEDWMDVGELATVRIEVEPVGEREVFVGIGPEDDVDAYLDGIAQARIDDVDLDPFAVDYEFTDGADQAPPPGEQTFWVAQGADGEPLEWELESGSYRVVIMNADGSAGVRADTSVGAKVDWLLPASIALLVVGLLVVAAGALLIVFGIRGLRAHPAMSSAVDPVVGGHPIRLRGRLDEPLSRWLWLVKWFLLIPHLFLLFFLWVGVVLVTIIAWFAILFTGRYPQRLFGYTLGVLRWTWRVSYYSYGALGTDRYPPFSFEAEADYPAALEVDYPERLSRGLVLVKAWFLAIPHLLILAVVAGWGSGWGWRDDGPSGGPALLDLLVLIVGGFLLFAGRYPRGLFDFIMGLNRWVVRVGAYVLLMRDEYPPFRLDQGEDEPPPPPAAAPVTPVEEEAGSPP